MLSNKRILEISGLVTISFLLSFFVVSAQEATDTSTSTQEQAITETRQENIESRQEERAEQIENRQDIRTERIEQRQAVVDERQTALTEVRQQRIINLSANISNRMESAIERLFNIVDRLEVRVTKMKQAGINTDSAEAKLRESAQLLAEARAKLGNIDTLVFNATTATEPKSEWQIVRQTYTECATLIRSSHQTLRETVSLLKTASTQINPATVESATTSTSTQSE